MFGTPCKIEQTRDHDLTSYFTHVSLEKGVDGVVPDVLLESGDRSERLFVEVAVTHKCEPGKIALGTRILEIEITEESDLELFETHTIDEQDRRVSLLNFKKTAVRGDLCRGDCESQLRMFLVYPSGKALVGWFTPSEAREFLSSRGMLRCENLGRVPEVELWGGSSGDGVLFKERVRQAFFEGVAVKNCFNCRYHGQGQTRTPIFCKVKKMRVPSHEAASCDIYIGFRDQAEAESADAANEAFISR